MKKITYLLAAVVYLTTSAHAQFVGINRTTAITGSEFFGIRATVGAGIYGGMYVETNNVAGLPFYGYATNNTAKAWTYFQPSNNSWRVFNGGDRLTVLNNGNVGIGTTTPTALLDVSGNVRATGSITSNLFEGPSSILSIKSGGDIEFFLEKVDNPSQFSYFEVFKTSGTAIFYVDESGNLGIVGNAFKPGGGSWAVSSDARLKKDIADYTDGLQTIRKIHPIKFRYNGLANTSSEKEYIGVIAQEMKLVAPYTVDVYKAKLHENDEKDTDLLQFDASAMPFMLTNAVKELDKEVQKLIEENNRIKDENAALKAKLIELETLKSKQAELEVLVQKLVRDQHAATVKMVNVETSK